MRISGTYPLPYNYEGEIEGLIDSRMFCPTYADLLTYTEANYLINGFPVFVYDDDEDLRGLYQLVDATDLSNPNSWEKISTKPERTSLIIADGANPSPIQWATDNPPGSSITYLTKHGLHPVIIEENLGDDATWTQNAAPAYVWNADRSTLFLYPQAIHTIFTFL